MPSFRFTTAMLLALAMTAATAGPAAGEAAAPPAKAGTTAARLLLPFFLVDTVNASGPTTLWAIRNETTSSVEVTVRYYEADRPDAPQVETSVTLGPKAIRTTDVRTVGDLRVDLDGFARGYVVFETSGGVIHGDYFQLDDGENFASGSRLVNVDPASNGNDLCNRFSMRFLDSSLFFDSGTLYNVWFEADEPFSGDAFSYSVYSQAGGDPLLVNDFPAAAVAFQVSADALLFIVEQEFGAIEFQFPAGTVGHVSAVLSAFGRFSVGYEATCLDSI